jgi:hypothetical protein
MSETADAGGDGDPPPADTDGAGTSPGEGGADRSDGSEGGRAYAGLPGAFPYAFRTSSSTLFRSYVLLGGLAVLLIALFMALALVVLFGATAGAAGGSLTLSRAFYVVIALLAAGPLLAPVLLVARRHRTARDDATALDGESGDRYDALLALSGYLFVGALYVGLVISVPPAQQEPVSGALAPTVAFLYGLPPLAGLLPPALAAGIVGLVHRFAR